MHRNNATEVANEIRRLAKRFSLDEGSRMAGKKAETYADRLKGIAEKNRAADAAKRGRPPSDPAKRAVLQDNVNKLFPLGAADCFRRIQDKFGELATKKAETIQAIFDGKGSGVATEPVRQIASVAGCSTDDLFTAGYADRPPAAATDFAIRTSTELGEMMPDIEDATDPDASKVAAASASLMNSELRHLHAFVTSWMLSRLRRKQERTPREAASLQRPE